MRVSRQDTSVKVSLPAGIWISPTILPEETRRTRLQPELVPPAARYPQDGSQSRRYDRYSSNCNPL